MHMSILTQQSHIRGRCYTMLARKTKQFNITAEHTRNSKTGVTTETLMTHNMQALTTPYQHTYPSYIYTTTRKVAQARPKPLRLYSVCYTFNHNCRKHNYVQQLESLRDGID